MFALFAERLPEHPFTQLGRARRHWRRERDSRAALYMRAGLASADALKKAEQELQLEAREALND